MHVRSPITVQQSIHEKYVYMTMTSPLIEKVCEFCIKLTPQKYNYNSYSYLEVSYLEQEQKPAPHQSSVQHKKGNQIHLQTLNLEFQLTELETL